MVIIKLIEMRPNPGRISFSFFAKFIEYIIYLGSVNSFAQIGLQSLAE